MRCTQGLGQTPGSVLFRNTPRSPLLTAPREREIWLHPRHGHPTGVCRLALGIPVCSLWLLGAGPELCPWGYGGRSSSIRILSPASCPRKSLSQPPCALHMIFSEPPRQLGHFRGECGASGGEGTGFLGPWGYPHSPVHWDPKAISLGFAKEKRSRSAHLEALEMDGCHRLCVKGLRVRNVVRRTMSNVAPAFLPPLPPWLCKADSHARLGF